MVPEVLLAYLLVQLYCLPGGIAFWRRHPQRWAISVLNVLLGWTGLGWIGALVWAATAVRTGSSGHAA
jgi:hypothetical protein